MTRSKEDAVIAQTSRRPRSGKFDADLRNVLNGFRNVVKVLRIADRAGIKAHGLGSAQIYVLHQLAQHFPLSVNELAELTATDQSSVSVVVNKLVDKGYVSSERSEEDGRKTALTLTEKGRKVFRETPPPFQQTLFDSLSHLPRARVRDLAATLHALATLMGAGDSRPPMFFEDRDNDSRVQTRRRPLAPKRTARRPVVRSRR
jgi:DNA-binding MarR family transcriptional regulator